MHVTSAPVSIKARTPGIFLLEADKWSVTVRPGARPVTAAGENRSKGRFSTSGRATAMALFACACAHQARAGAALKRWGHDDVMKFARLAPWPKFLIQSAQESAQRRFKRDTL